MRALVDWLIKKGDNNTLLVTSKLRSRKAVPIIQKRTRRKLTQDMLDFLESDETLCSWQGKTLKERAALFSKKYAPLTISPQTLSNAYKKLGIRKKKVRETKIVPEK